MDRVKTYCPYLPRTHPGGASLALQRITRLNLSPASAFSPPRVRGTSHHSIVLTYPFNLSSVQARANRFPGLSLKLHQSSTPHAISMCLVNALCPSSADCVVTLRVRLFQTSRKLKDSYNTTGSTCYRNSQKEITPYLNCWRLALNSRSSSS